MRRLVNLNVDIKVARTSSVKQQIIYKHAISTIVPERPVPLCDPGELE